MGLADRFKDSLEQNDIFKKVETPQPRPSVAYVSNPISRGSNYEDLETEIISKIRKTPYWSEYSALRQRKMIESYFCKKQQQANFSQNEKEEFIQNILILSNNQ